MSEETYTDSIGWNYRNDPPQGDQRKLVWLEQNGMGWIGIRVWAGQHRRWFSNNEPELATVVCWMDLPERPLRHWDRGKLSPEMSGVRRQLRSKNP